MNNWFTVRVKYTKAVDNGTYKRVSEPYLIAAMTFSDAEARIYEELGSVIKGEFMVTGIARTELHDIFAYDDADTWFKCKVRYDNYDADSEKAKKVTQNFIVAANSVKEAYDRMQESLAGMMVDFEIPAVVSSPIIDIFPFSEELDREISRRPVEEEVTEVPQSKGVVYSAAGTASDDEMESEVADDYEE